tara:strand:- start:649 stop:1173 length:525 start_codon:yes stop_codon:yes gene_type:complete
MSEEKLQSDIVRKFSELYPLKRGQLFHVPNERITESQKLKAKSIGVFSGVSDLLHAEGLTPEKRIVLQQIISEFVSSKEMRFKLISMLTKEFNLGILNCLELKAPESYHKVTHVQQQVDWGRTMELLGNGWRIITSVEDAINFINFKPNKGLNTDEVQEMLDEAKAKNKKTIKF